MKKTALLVLFFVLVLYLSLSGTISAKTLKIGLHNEPKTLNPFTARDVWSKHVLDRIYQDLYAQAPKTFELVPWIAKSLPEYNSKDNTVIIKMRKAKWDDGTPLTAHDVVFTANVIKELKVPKYAARWKFIKKIEALDDYTLKYWLTEPRSTFYSRTILNFIVQKKQWKPIVDKAKKTEKPLQTLLKYKNDNPIGNGPFKFESWQSGSSIKLVKNQDYFAKGREIDGKKVGPYVDGILFKIYGTTDAAILALKNGDVDYIWWSIQPGFVENLKKDKDIEITENKENGLRYFAFNLRKAPFQDKNFRHAVAYLIDKDFMVQRILQKRGSRMDSIVPPGNEYWYNPGVPDYGKGMTQAQRLEKAVEILKKAGYTWEKEPEIKKDRIKKAGKGLTMPDGKKIPDIDILTPPADYDPLRAMAGIQIQGWLNALGVDASAKPASMSFISDKVKIQQDFDCYILGYMLGMDPSYLKSFFHSSEIKKRGRNTSGYKNEHFDRLAIQFTKEMDMKRSQKIAFEMQSVLMEDLPWIPLFNASVIEGYRKNRFTGWVNQLNGIGNTWSFLFLKPVK